MEKLLCVGCAVAMAFCAKAAVLDLNGVDKEVTSLSEYPDGFTNTSDTQAKLTLVISEDVTYAGPISGNLKLVKRMAKARPSLISSKASARRRTRSSSTARRCPAVAPTARPRRPPT